MGATIESSDRSSFFPLGDDLDMHSATEQAEMRMREERSVVADIVQHLEWQKSKQNSCESCGDLFDDQHFSDGFLVCNHCGLVKDVHIDNHAEWRCFNNSNGVKDTSGVRCGDIASTLLPSTQLNTFMGGKDKRLQKVHQWNNLTAKERNLHQIYKEFEQIGYDSNLPKNIVSTATELYSKLYTEMENKNCGVKRCNVRQGLKAACLYFACKRWGMARERKEIAEMMGNTTKIVTKGCNSFLDIMGGDFIKMEPFRPADFVSRFSILLGLSYPQQLRLQKITNYVSSLGMLSDNTPTSVASACIYFLSSHDDLGISKEDIHEKCGSSQIIITKTFNRILPYKSEITKLLESEE